MSIDTTSNREFWEFEYTCNALAIAAEVQKEYRLSRVKAWEDKKAEIMAKIKDTGLTVHESVAEKMSSYSNNVNPFATVMVDKRMQEDLTEAVTRIKTHRDLARHYDGWVQMLNANPEARVKLKHSDWMFFFGK